MSHVCVPRYYSEQDKKIVGKQHLGMWWRVILMPVFFPYAMYRSWRGINQANKLLDRKKKLIMDKKDKNIELTNEEEDILKQEKISNWYKLWSVLIPLYAIYRGILGIKDENKNIDLKKEEVRAKYAKMETKFIIKTPLNKHTPDPKLQSNGIENSSNSFNIVSDVPGNNLSSVSRARQIN